MIKKTIVVFSGAGISAESGIDTFRDQGGLWEKHRIEDVATPEAWRKNPERVLNFYNMRVEQLRQVKPNTAHTELVKLEQKYNTIIITQNVDDLHERAGSSQVIHLHGELAKCRSEHNENYLTGMPEKGLHIGDKCPQGYQLRPHIVWFGEMVPEMDRALETVRLADTLIVVGTSLNVYPAAGLAYAAPSDAEVVLIDPANFNASTISSFRHIQRKATEGVKEVVAEYLAKA